MINKQKGYTLLELVFYIAFLGLLSVLVVNVFMTMTKSFVEIRSMRDLTQSASVSMERMIREIRDADSVQLADSVFNSSPGSLSLQSVEGGVTRTVKFVVSGTDLQMYENSVLVGVLNGDSVSVNSFIVRSISTPVSEGIKIELTLQENRSNISRVEDFYGAAMLRGSY